jgi:hypothetical protein
MKKVIAVLLSIFHWDNIACHHSNTLEERERYKGVEMSRTRHKHVSQAFTPCYNRHEDTPKLMVSQDVNARMHPEKTELRVESVYTHTHTRAKARARAHTSKTWYTLPSSNLRESASSSRKACI